MKHWIFSGFRVKIAVGFVALILVGCVSIDSQYRFDRPQVDIPGRWTNALEGGLRDVVSNPWWRAFDDAPLNDLISRMLQANQSLESRAFAIDSANQAAKVAGLNGLPSIGLSYFETRSRKLYGEDGERGSSKQLTFKSASASIVFDFDIWGTLRSNANAARWQARASRQDWEWLVLQQIGAMVILYGNLAYSIEQIEQNEQAIGYVERTLDMASIAHRLGSNSAMDVKKIEQSLVAQRGRLAMLSDQKRRVENAIRLLLNDTSSMPIAVSRDVLDRGLPEVFVDAPSSLFLRRPDLKAAEMRLRASMQLNESTRTSFYPFSLKISTNSGGYSIRQILDLPVAILDAMFSLPNLMIVGPIVKQSEAVYKAEAAMFKQTFYGAIREVEDALSSREGLAAQALAQARNMSLSIEIERRTAIAYGIGAVSLKTYLDSQEARRSSESQMSGIRNAQWANTVELYLALGGGTEAL